MMNMDVNCDFCNDNKAKYDAKSIYGPWGYMCPSCFSKYGIKIKDLFTVINDSIEDDINQEVLN